MILAKRSAFALAGSLFSCSLFAAGFWLWSWPAALVLLGFWLEETVTLSFSVLKTLVLRRQLGEQLVGALVLLFFPFLHLIFIIVFIFIDADATPASETLLHTLKYIVTGHPTWADHPTLFAVLSLTGGILFWGCVDFVRTLRLARAARAPTPEELFARSKAVMVLPHLTIIGGGFALVSLGLGAWMTTGLIVGKLLGELLMIPVRSELAQASSVTVGAATQPAALEQTTKAGNG